MRPRKPLGELFSVRQHLQDNPPMGHYAPETLESQPRTDDRASESNEEFVPTPSPDDTIMGFMDTFDHDAASSFHTYKTIHSQGLQWHDLHAFTNSTALQRELTPGEAAAFHLTGILATISNHAGRSDASPLVHSDPHEKVLIQKRILGLDPRFVSEGQKLCLFVTADTFMPGDALQFAPRKSAEARPVLQPSQSDAMPY